MAEDSEMSAISMMDISKLKVQDLKKELKLRGLSVTGNKNELAERLQNALSKSERIISESVDDLEEDLLNDDDDEHLDASESVILENDLDESPKATKRKIDDNTEVKSESAPPKKVILNRHTSIEMTKSIIDNTETKQDDIKGEQKEDKKVIKLSSLSAKERLEMRAKKFGVTDLSSDAKKIVRAERFGTKNSVSSESKSSKITVTTSVDVLKQRAERFGGSVSSVMSGLENQEKLEKRKARFGLSSSTNGTTVSDSEKVKKQRLERFKQPVT